MLTAPLYGLALFAGAASGAFAYFLTARDPSRAKPLRDAAHAPHPAVPRATHRILVIADEALEGPDLRREIVRRVELWPELLVVAAILSSRLHFWASDFDRSNWLEAGLLDRVRSELDVSATRVVVDPGRHAVGIGI